MDWQPIATNLMDWHERPFEEEEEIRKAILTKPRRIYNGSVSISMGKNQERYGEGFSRICSRRFHKSFNE